MSIQKNETVSPLDTKVEHVSAAALQHETSLRVRFSRVDSKAAKAPICHGLVYMTGPLAGLVIPSPGFKDAKSGSISFAMPGGTFGKMRPAPQTIDANGTTYTLDSPEPAGQAKADLWDNAMKTAYLAWQTTGNPEQRIAL